MNLIAKKNVWLICAVSVTLSAFFFSFSAKQELPVKVRIADKTYTLEIADTPDERTVGLRGRENLCQNCAMLFIFPEKKEHSFWMKGMRFPLDIVWLTGEKTVHIERNVPFASQSIYVPEEAADRVLEVNAGEANVLERGQSVEFLYK